MKKFISLMCAMTVSTVMAQGVLIDELFTSIESSTRTTTANDTVYVDMSKYSGLERSTPLVAQDGRVYKFTNGQLTRLNQLNNSAMVIAKNGSTLVFSKDAVIYGGEFKTGYPIVAAEGGTIKMEGGTITSYMPDPHVLSGARYITRDYAIGMEPANYKNHYEMISGKISETWGILNNAGTISIKGGSISNSRVGIDYRGGLIKTKSDVELSGNAEVTSIDFEDSSVHLIITSSLKSNIRLWCEPKDFSILGENSDWNFDGRIVAEWKGPNVSSSDLDKISMDYFHDSTIQIHEKRREWVHVIENEKIVIREKNASNLIDTEDKLIAAINAATSGTSKEPISIEIAADIYLTKTINIENKYLKLSGGYKLIRAKSHTEELFNITKGQVTLENITIDGNKAEFPQGYVKSAFMLDGSTLVMGKESVLTNHVVGHSHDGLITSIYSMSEFRMDGGEIKDNDLKMATLLALYKGSFNFSSGSIHNNVAAYGIAETTWLWMTGGEVYNNNCDYYGFILAEDGSDHVVSGGRIDAGQGGIYAHRLYIKAPESIKDIIYFEKDPNFYCDATIKNTLTFMPRSSKDEESFYEGMVLLTGHDFTQSECDKVNLISEKWKVELKPSTNFKNRKDIVLVLKQPALSPIDSLFGDLEDGPKGTEQDPIDILFDRPGVEVDKPTDVPDDIHVLFGEKDDKPDGTPSTKVFSIRCGGDYVLRIPSRSSVEFKNIEVDFGNQTLKQFIYVDGTVIFNVNVTFVNVYSYIKYIIYVRKGGKVIWRGGYYNLPGVVIVNDGGTVTYEGGEIYGGEHGISNPSGTVSITGGTIGGHIHGIHGDGIGSIIIRGGHIYGGGTSGGVATSGTADGGHAIYNGPYSGLYIYDGTFDYGSSIWSEGPLTIDGRINVRDIYIRRNIYITVVSRIVVNWYIHFIDSVTIDMGIPLVYGGEGYRLTEDDLAHLHVDLPSGFYLKLDTRLNAIIIVDYDPAGIDYVGADQVEDTYYSVDGVRQETLGRGLNIIKSSDGTIKKIMR